MDVRLGHMVAPGQLLLAENRSKADPDLLYEKLTLELSSFLPFSITLNLQ
jgi:hypothetical protein